MGDGWSVVYAITSGSACTINTSNGALTSVGLGAVTVTATLAYNDVSLASTTTSVDVTVNTPSFTMNNMNMLIGDSTAPTVNTLTNITNSEKVPTHGSIVYSGNALSNIATTNGSTVTATSPGSETFTATYYAADGTTSLCSTTFTVTVANPTLVLSVGGVALTSESVIDLFRASRSQTITASLTGVTSVSGFKVTLPADTSYYTFTSADFGNTITITSLNNTCDATAFTATLSEVNGINVSSKGITASAKAKVSDYVMTFDAAYDTPIELYSNTAIDGTTALTAADKARDYVNEKIVTVTHNSSSDYNTKVTAESSNDSIATVSPTLDNSAGSDPFTITAVAAGTATITFKYIDITNSDAVLATQVITVNVSNYDTEMTIYFEDNGTADWNDITQPYVYHFGGGNEGFLVTRLLKIGQNGSKNVYANTFKKADIMGLSSADNPGKLIFSTDTSFTHKTTNIFPDNGDGTNPNINSMYFADYQYFRMAANTTILFYNYGSLKPTAFTGEFSDTEIVRTDNDSSAVDIELTATATNYDSVAGSAAFNGYYVVTNADNCLTIPTAAGAMTAGEATVAGILADGDVPAGPNTVVDSTESYTASVNGTVFFSATDIVTTPLTDSNAKTFLGLDFSAPITINVNAAISTVTVAGYKMDTVSGGYVSASMGQSATDLTPLWDQDVTVYAPVVDDYTFIGFYKDDEAPAYNADLTSDATNYIPVSDSNITYNSTDSRYEYTFTNASDTSATYEFSALYRKNYSFSTYKTYVLDGSVVHYVTAPPKTITVTRHGEVVATYNYNSAINTATAFGDYGMNVAITAGAGDSIELHYVSLPSSDAITFVGFDNNMEHVYLDPPTASSVYHERYQMTAENSGLVIDSNNHKVTFLAGYGDTAQLQSGSTEPETVGYDRLRITIDVTNKKRVIFSDSKGKSDGVTPVSGYSVGGYYMIGSAVDFTVKGEETAKKLYTLNAPVITDEDGDPVSATVTPLEGGQYRIQIASMPGKDVEINFSPTVQYGVNFRTYIVSDITNNKSGKEIDSAVDSTITATYLSDTEFIAHDATALKGAYSSNYEKRVDAGGSIKYSIGTLTSGYTLIGWYYGDDSTFEYKNYIGSGDEQWFTPENNTTVWCVVTCDFFINGNWTDTVNRTDWIMTGGSTNDNQRMKFDPETGRYYYTFNDTENFPLSATGTIPNTNTGDNADKTIEFVIFDKQNTDDTTAWQKVTFSTTEDDSDGYVFAGSSDSDYHGVYWGRRDGTNAPENHRKNGFFYQSTAQASAGYSTKVTVYFYPSLNSTNRAAGKFDIYVEAEKNRNSLYVSDGYQGIEGATTSNSTKIFTKIGEGSFVEYTAVSNASEVDVVSHTGWGAVSGGEGDVVDYLVKKVNQTNLTIKVSRKVNTNFKVSYFDVYDLTTGDITSYPATPVDGDAQDFYCTFKMGEHNLYIVPIIEDCTAGKKMMEVVFDASELDDGEWGDLVSCYAWYTNSKGDAYGSYPGQLMYKVGTTWKAKFPALKSITETVDEEEVTTPYSLAGITFANYFDGAGHYITWLGRPGVMSGGAQGSEARAVVNQSNIIPEYNYISRANSNFNACNVKVQTYDYHEPVSLYDSMDPSATSVTLNFSVKPGNNAAGDIMSWRHSELTAGTANILNNIVHRNSKGNDVVEHMSTSDFEYLKDSSGAELVDLNGNFVDGEPTPSYYIVSKGMVTYNSGTLTRVFSTGSENQTIDGAAAYVPLGSDDLNYAVEWYVYDAAGNYLFDTLSSAYCDTVTVGGKEVRVISKMLTDLGYAVENKSVMISYDNPRYCYNDSDGGVKNAGSSFDCYRFEGQWYAASTYEMVKLNTLVALKSGSGYKVAEDNWQAYGQARIYYDDSLMTGYTAYHSRIKYDKKAYSYVQFVKNDLTYATTESRDIDFIQLDADSTNFLGWFMLEGANTLSAEKVSESPTLYLESESIETGQTYVALYKVEAQYKFTYTGNHGQTVSLTYTRDLVDCEINGYFGNGNVAGIPTYIWGTGTSEQNESQIAAFPGGNPYQTALSACTSGIFTYQYNLDWTVGEGLATRNINAGTKTVEIVAASVTENYYVNCYDVDVNGDVINETKKVVPVPANNILTFNFNYSGDNITRTGNIATWLGFTYWSADKEGLQPLTSIYTFGLIVTHDMTIYAQHRAIPDSVKPWIPSVESLSQTRTKTNDTDKIYLDFNTYFVSNDFRKIHDIETKPHYGVFIAYTDSDVYDATKFLDKDSRIKAYIKYLALTGPSSGKVTKTVEAQEVNTYMAVYDFNDNDHISDFNRANFSLSGDYSYLNDKKLTFYSYVIENGTVYISNTTLVSNKVTVAPKENPDVFIWNVPAE